MDKIITEAREDAVTLRWLQQATDTDRKGNGKYRRPILSGVYCEDGRAVACDGFRMHIAPRPEPLKVAEDGQIVRIRDGKGLHKTPGRVYQAEEVEGNYPDYQQIDPARGQGEPTFTLAVNAEYLREALELPNPDAPADRVVLRFYTENGPFTVESDNGEYKAVVMPMSKD